MDLNQLEQGMRDQGCTPVRNGVYSSLLLRCGCGNHALAAAACEDNGDKAVKLFGAALSWYIRTGQTKPLTYVIGNDSEEHWKSAAHAIQMLKPTGIKVDLQCDFAAAPPLVAVDLSSARWVAGMEDVEKRPLPAVALALAAEAAVEGFAWYRSVTGPKWSGRIEGLQVCTLSDAGSLTFDVGEEGAGGAESRAREKFREIADCNRTLFEGSDAGLDVVRDSAQKIRAVAILRALGAGAIGDFGSEEHRFESRVLRGAVKLEIDKQVLSVVTQGQPFKFPARWWPDGRPRYMDVLAQQGRVPWVVELKVARGQGEYVRDGIVQVALYRQFVLLSPGLDSWFAQHGLDRGDCRAALVVPPFRGPNREALLADHRRIRG